MPIVNLRRTAVSTCLLLSLLAPPAVMAQDVPARAYDLPETSLESVLMRIARDSGRVLALDGDQVQGRRSAAVRGTLTPEQAMREALRGSGLELQIRDDGTLTLVPAPGDGAVRLGPVRVEAAVEREPTAWAPVAGYVAKRSATGTKTDTPLIETPQAINIVSREEFVARGATRTVLEALEYTPGFVNTENVNTRFDYGQLRGFSVYQNMYLDGLSLPYGLDRASPQVEPFGLERVEVLKGPASVLYGQTEPGGIINTVSKRPTAVPQGELLLTLGSYERMEAGVDFSGPLTDDARWQYRLIGFGRNAEAQIDFVKDDRAFFAPSVTWQPSEQTSLTLLAHYQLDRGGEFNNTVPYSAIAEDSPLGRVPVSRNTGEPNDRYDRRQYAIGYAFDHAFSDAFSISQNARFQSLNVVYDNVIFPDLRDDGRTVDRTLYEFDETLDTLAIDTRVQARFSTGVLQHTLLAGVDLRKQEGESANGYHYHAGGTLDLFEPVYGETIVRPGYNSFADLSLEQWGFYLQDQIRLGKWSFMLGGRYDNADNRYESAGLYPFSDNTRNDAFTGRVGMVYLFDNGVTPYLSWSESFQPVTLAGVDYDGNPFKPTTGQQYELGIKYQPPRQTAFVTLSVFELSQQNVLTQDLERVDEGFFQKQVGEIRVRGVELEGKAEWGRLDVVASYSWMQSEFTRSNDGNQGLEAADVPRHQMALWADYRLGGFADGVNVGAGVRRTGKRFGDDYETLVNDAITLVDMTVGYDLGRAVPSMDGVRLAFTVRNLADEEYISCSGGNYCSYGLLRTVQGSLSYRW